MTSREEMLASLLKEARGHVFEAPEGDTETRGDLRRRIDAALNSQGERATVDPSEIDYDDPRFNQGVQHVVEMLSRMIGAEGWVAGDGSEDYDSDLEQTLLNILTARGLYDKETGEYSVIRSHTIDALEELRCDTKRLARELQQGLPKRNAAEQLEAMSAAADKALTSARSPAEVSFDDPSRPE